MGSEDITGEVFMLTFFTDIYTDVSNYCLLNIKHYKNKRKPNKKVCYIDPSVYELTKSDEYSNIEFMYELIEKDRLLDNEYISIDYPCDMNPEYTDLFIEKSYKNNVKYKDNHKYICTLQSKFMDFESFIYETERLNPIWSIPGKIIGIGNMCRIMYSNEFTENIFKYIKDNMQGHKIHFYGLGMRVLRSEGFRSLLNMGMDISVDSTKWTRAITVPLKKQYGASCRKVTRDIFFLEYMEHLKRNNIEVVY